MEVENEKGQLKNKKTVTKKETTKKTSSPKKTNDPAKKESKKTPSKKTSSKKTIIKEETLTEEPKKEVIPIIKNEIHEDPNYISEIKAEKKSNIKKEIKSFFILLLIIGLIVGVTWYWYTYMYDKNRNKEEEQPTSTTEQINDISYDIKSYKSSTNLALVNDKYILEYSDKYIYKVLDTNLDVIFEGEQYYNDFYYGNDDKLYIITEDIADYENIIDIYVLSGNEFIKKDTLNDSSVQYKPIITNDEILLGFIGYYDCSLDETSQDEELTNYLYLLGQTKKEIGKMIIDENNIIENDSFIKNTSTDYLIVSLDNKIGVYDIKTNDYLINPHYTKISPGLNNEFIVTDKDELSCIVDKNDKNVLEMTYDFISPSVDYYVLGKNKKVSIMNRNHDEIANLELNYRHINDDNIVLDDGAYDFFNAYDVHGKIVLEHYNVFLSGNNQTVNIYIFDENGAYETVTTDYFSYDKETDLIYTYNSKNKELTIYNDKLEVAYDIDLSIYNYKNIPFVNVYNNDLLFVNIGNGLYFDRYTGESQGEKHEIVYEDQDFKTIYNSKDKKLTVTIGDKTEEYKVYSFDQNANLIRKEDGTYLIFYDNLTISIIPTTQNTNE